MAENSQRIATVSWLGSKSARGRGKAQMKQSVVLLVKAIWFKLLAKVAVLQIFYPP